MLEAEILAAYLLFLFASLKIHSTNTIQQFTRHPCVDGLPNLA
jgi:hypothetical protein